MTTKIIMDTDPGIDDAAALTMAINETIYLFMYMVYYNFFFLINVRI